MLQSLSKIGHWNLFKRMRLWLKEEKESWRKYHHANHPLTSSCFSLFEFAALELSQWSVRSWKNFARRQLKK